MDRFAATFWDDSYFHALCISGMRFPTREEARQYGKKTFGEHFEDVVQVEWAEENRPF